MDNDAYNQTKYQSYEHNPLSSRKCPQKYAMQTLFSLQSSCIPTPVSEWLMDGTGRDGTGQDRTGQEKTGQGKTDI